MLSTMFALVEVENEENVLVCFRVTIDLHKHFKPPFTKEVRFNIQWSCTVSSYLPIVYAVMRRYLLRFLFFC